MTKDSTADICIVSEGSYPYNSGGVAQWVAELVEEHQEKTFHILSLLPPHPDKTFKYKFPKNVIGHSCWVVQELPEGALPFRAPKGLWHTIEKTLKGMITSSTFENYDPLFELFQKHRHLLGKRMLTESMDSWKFILSLYYEVIPSGPFKAYFGTIYTLSRSIYSILSPELPKARLYHAVCTGYAGFILHRAKKELSVPCFITEHGIYSNERRIEIAMADWIAVMGSQDLSLEERRKNLKDFWLNAFLSMAHVCYESCDEIMSTFDGNQEIQLEGGADPKKMHPVVHGIDQKNLSFIHRSRKNRPPTVAFIGRVVPIKDVKTFIRACKIVKERMPEVRFWALGPYEEDPEYFRECLKLADFLGMRDHIRFFGKVNLKEYFPQVDILVLTSISEAQPLVILEAGATGMPCVASNVGACNQLINGSVHESPKLGPGGIVTGLVNPEETAEAIIKLLKDESFYDQCSKTMAERIRTYYVFQKEHETYRNLYNKYLGSK